MATKETMAQKYSKLNGEADAPWATNDVDANAKQLIYPIGLGSSTDHSGLAVVFEFNTITEGKTTPYESTLTGSASRKSRRVDSQGNVVDNVETSLSRDAGSTSLRNSDISLGGQKGTYKKSDISVVLPPPEGFNHSLKANWNNAEMGGIGRAGDFINSLKAGDKAALLKQIGGTSIDVLSKISTGLGGPDVKNWAQMVTGLSQNNYNETVFSHVDNRTFSFKWTLVPRNETEANIINSLVHRFRWAMLPQLFDETGANASFFKAPWTFDIHFIDINTGIESKKYPKIGTSALLDVRVDMAPKGEFSIVGDEQQSLGVTLELSFSELFILHKGMLENGAESSY